MRSLWLSPGFPAASTALLDVLGSDYVLAPPSPLPPAGSVAIATSYETDLLRQLEVRSPNTRLLVISPPDATQPLARGSSADAVVSAASIADVAAAVRRLPVAPPSLEDPTAPMWGPAAAGAAAAGAAAGAAASDLPWWVRGPQDDPAPAGPHIGAVGSGPLHDTAALPAYGQPVHGQPTETLALGSEPAGPGKRRRLTARQAQLASLAAVIAAVGATAIVVSMDHHSAASNTAATSPLGTGQTGTGQTGTGQTGTGQTGTGQTGTGQTGTGQGGAGTGGTGQGGTGTQGLPGQGTAPGFGQGGVPGTDDSTRLAQRQKFLACLKANGVTITGTGRLRLDPSDPTLGAALQKCASLMPFGRFGPDHFGSGGTGTSPEGTGSSTQGKSTT